MSVSAGAPSEGELLVGGKPGGLLVVGSSRSGHGEIVAAGSGRAGGGCGRALGPILFVGQLGCGRLGCRRRRGDRRRSRRRVSGPRGGRRDRRWRESCTPCSRRPSSTVRWTVPRSTTCPGGCSAAGSLSASCSICTIPTTTVATNASRARSPWFACSQRPTVPNIGACCSIRAATIPADTPSRTAAVTMSANTCTSTTVGLACWIVSTTAATAPPTDKVACVVNATAATPAWARIETAAPCAVPTAVATPA